MYVRSQPIADWRYTDGPENILSACFICICRKNETPQAADDLAELRWFPLDGFRMELVHPNHQDLVRGALGMLEKALHDATVPA
jgi:hypothetical protein